MIDELEKMANLNIPRDFSSDEANKHLVDACAKFQLNCPPPQTTARLLDKVCFLSFFCLATMRLCSCLTRNKDFPHRLAYMRTYA